MSGEPSDADAAVRQQYERYPYPARDPAQEAQRLVEGSPSHVDELTHYVFAGARPSGRALRVLVAGGGTGDALVMLAQQAADRGVAAEITYLDPSAAARAVAEARIAARGLSVRFVTGMIEEIGRLAPGPFDYIDCCGVLHHLADPAAGLDALAAALDPGGGIGLMVYAPHGREGVYPLQSALRRLAAADGADLDQRIALARRLLKDLPASNGFRRNPVVGDHLRDDAGLVDLLLHSRDRPYTVGELANLVDGAGLAIAAFVPPLRYAPASYLSDEELVRRTTALEPLAGAALAEELAGTMKTHVVYAVPAARAGQTVADPADVTLCPVLRGIDGPALAAGLRPGATLKLELDGLTLSRPMPPLAAAMLNAMDGATPIAAVKAAAAAQVGRIAEAVLDRQFRQLFDTLNGAGKLFLRRL